MHLCLVGCGYIASHHARVLRKLGIAQGEPVQLSFASRDKAKADSFKASYGGTYAFGSYTEAVSHQDIDAVVVCTPNADHHRTALLAIAQRKHVIVEKPFATTVAQADEMLDHAARAGVEALVAENHRYLPHVRWLEGVLAAGTLGTPKMVRVNFMRRLSFRDGEWRASAASMGGGVLIDGGVHWVNTLLTLGGGEATNIVAVESRRTLTGCPGEDTIVVSCALRNGAVGVLTYSWNIAPSWPDRFLAVHGDTGSAYVENSGRFGVTISGSRSRVKWFPRRDREGFFAMWQDFLAGLGSSRQSGCLATGAVGRRDLAFVEAAYRCRP